MLYLNDPRLWFTLGGIVIFVGLMAWARAGEKKEWNNGTNALNGREWVSFDVDSQGGRGYDDGVGNTIWITYGVDKKRSIG